MIARGNYLTSRLKVVKQSVKQQKSNIQSIQCNKNNKLLKMEGISISNLVTNKFSVKKQNVKILRKDKRSRKGQVVYV
jgi:hypothetical protein